MAETIIREDFPIFRDNPSLVYLDNAATTQKPSCVIEAVRHFYECDNANPLRGLYDLAQRATAVYEESREAVAGFIGAASPEEIVFTRNASESLNLVAYSYGTFLREGDEILISVMEHHSNLIPWQQLAARSGAVLKFIECGIDGKITEEAFRQALSPRTKIVSMTQISNVLGIRNDIKTFARLAHEAGGAAGRGPLPAHQLGRGAGHRRPGMDAHPRRLRSRQPLCELRHRRRRGPQRQPVRPKPVFQLLHSINPS